MRPQASRQRPRSATARRHSRRSPFVHPIPRSCPPRRSRPSFRHSPVQAWGRLCAGRNPCDLKLPVSAPDQRRPAATHATSLHPPHPRSCPPRRSRPSFPSFPCSSQGQALRSQESMRPQASRQAPQILVRRPAATPPRPFTHCASLGLVPLFPVIPAQAGIHATSSFPSAPQISDGPPPLTPRSLHPPHPSVLPLFSVIPAQAGIHATSSFPSTPQISDGPPPLTPLPFVHPRSPPATSHHSRLVPIRSLPSCCGLRRRSRYRGPRVDGGARCQHRSANPEVNKPRLLAQAVANGVAGGSPAVRRRPRGEGSPLLSLRDISPRRAGGDGIRTQSPDPRSGGRVIQSFPSRRPPRRHP